ncbi:unnamed protein product [Chondrus crispus]|uniref:Uncharacterized protein n=1 Tax=Chondrus crispus TaxID=2769 RepID=R7QDA4_CHOCR|nr:unnamed protein product [Chondrus crispus]CDF35426.1 unnamed protein product [Chondrus crispus]|eukprot:XP_005715245.1 unnamed protein product [Chondrus crispus]
MSILATENRYLGRKRCHALPSCGYFSTSSVRKTHILIFFDESNVFPVQSGFYSLSHVLPVVSQSFEHKRRNNLYFFLT